MNIFSIPRKPIAKQVIVITGASSGIGLATARLAVKLGAQVVLSSRNESDLKALAKEIKQAGGNAIAAAADVSREEDVQALKDRAIVAYGRIDSWINNAGASIYGRLMDLTFEEEKQVFETNFWGVRHGSRIAVPELEKTQGVLINVGSEVSARSIPLQGIYAASKHAVKAYTDALRMELEKDKIPVAISLVRPTAIATPFPEHAANRLREGIPALPDPMYHPDAVAAAILDCCEHPRRDVFVGAPSKLYNVLEALVPRVLDRMIEFRMFKEQTKGNPAHHREENEGLMHAPRTEGKILGKQKGKVKKESAYTVATRKGRKAGKSSELHS
jgi:short-subunit dehydrogenase